MKGNETLKIFDCIPEIDAEYGYRYFLGNMDNYKQGLLSILKSIKAKLPILQSMQKSEEYEGLRMITQTLRRMLGNVGALGISELSYQLEIILLNESEGKLRESLEEYINCLVCFSENLEILLKNMDVMNTERKEISFGKYDFTKTKESIKLSEGLLGRKII